MKQKIKEALQQRHKNLGLSEEVFERVAASVETFITDEGAIDGFAQSENTLNLLKSYQSVNDKLRAFEKKNEPNEKTSENGNQPNPNPEPPKADVPDFKAMFADALAEIVNPLKEELATFKAEQSAKSALAGAEAAFKGNDYVKKYADEATDAWERAMEMYEATGKAWTAEQLNERAMGYFNKAVKRKGVDTTKPLESDGAGTSKPDFASDVALLQDKGLLPKTEPLTN